MKKIIIVLLMLPFTLAIAKDKHHDKMKVEMFNTQTDKSIGYIKIIDTKYGVIFAPELHDVPNGYHGFHLHVNADCGDGGMNAGGHYDPAETNSHKGPYENGHLGDLPVLYSNDKNNINDAVLAPRITFHDLKNHSLMIHAGGDNYSDTPAMGGGGARFACGVIKK